ncbi:deoxyribodipyrimidine photo-lyase [Brevundimonas sp. Root1423]|uniref:deoxyribodipyrimidine photo-lyase n=1 Tax=Brevundimonas sp. Root1423 TaxID=1736462 RepID=UPI000B0C1B3D
MTTKADDRPVILWFRQDLRLADNPALTHALETGRPIVPVYILDQGAAVRPMGAASLWWLDKSLRALEASLRERGSRLILRRGDSEAELLRLVADTGADAVYMNRLFEPDAFARDADIAHTLKTEGVDSTGQRAERRGPAVQGFYALHEGLARHSLAAAPGSRPACACKPVHPCVR